VLKILLYKVRFWLPFAVTITALSLLVHVSTQQVLRQSANDPQIQMAEDTANTLSNGSVSPEELAGGEKIELTQSIKPYLTVFDESGNVVASSAMLNGADPKIPQGITNYIRNYGEDRVTLEPQNGVRIAAIIVKYPGGFVLAGRSLRETEMRVDQNLLIVGLSWFATMFASLLSVLIFIPFPKKTSD
jgi:hypothetical protein